MEKVKLYIVGFIENDIIKKKIYLFDCVVYNFNYYPIIIITYNKYIFSINNDIWKAWT